MPSFPIRDFARGISDHYMSGRGCQRLDNFVLDAAGNPLQRSGQVNWSARIPANQKVTDLHYSIRTPGALFAHSAGNIYWDAPVFSWQAITGDNSTKPGYGADTTYRASFQGNGPFNYVHFWAPVGDNGGLYLTFPKPKKILRPGIPGSFTVNLGLPKPAAPVVSAGTNTTGGAGGFSYLYYAVYVYTYEYNDVTYIERSAPSAATSITFDFAIAAGRTAKVTVSAVATDTLYTPAEQNYPRTADVRVEVYRTKVNETVPYRIPFNPPDNSVAQSSALSTDNFTDATISAETELYTADGTSPFDEPPACRFFHIVNDIAYYGGFFLNSGYDNEVSLLQSVPGVPTSAPADNELRCPEPLTGGISSADIYPIVLCAGSLWRIEGTIDSFGAGAPIFRLISDRVGCQLPYTVKKSERLVYFVATDGHHYATDGFTLKKMTEHVIRQLSSFQNSQETVIGDLAVEPKTGRLLVSYASSGSDQDTVFVGDPRQPLEDGGVAYTTLSGRDHETLGKIFSPCSMLFLEPNILYFGNRQGYVMRLYLEPDPVATTSVANDLMPDTSLAINLWDETAVVPDWISGAQHYGYPLVTKITTGVTAQFQFKSQQTALFAEIMSYREGQYRSEAVKAEENACAPIRETALAPARQTFEAFRRLRRQGLRASLRQFRVRKGFLTIYASDPDDVNAYVQATTSATLKTAQLPGSAWPTDIKNAYLYLSATGYERGFLITAVSGDTVTVRDTPGLWPTGVFYWEIKNYPLGQWLHPLGLEVDFFPLGTPENVATAAKAGENVGRP